MGSIEQTAKLYRSLRFNAIGKGLQQLLAEAEANDLSYLQFAHQLAEYESGQRNRKRVERNRRLANFPDNKTLDAFDYQHQTTITKRQVNQLLDFSFIDNRANLVFIGPPGVGKTHLAIGIGHKAIDAGFKVLCTTALGLVETLELAADPGGAEEEGGKRYRLKQKRTS